MKYIRLAIVVAVVGLGWLYWSTSAELARVKGDLAVAVGVNNANAEATKRLERSMDNTDDVLAKWNDDRTTLAGVRTATRQAIKEAMRDETFRTWASSPAPADAWRLLNAPSHADGSGSSDSAGQSDAGLPGNVNPKQRIKQ